MSHYSSHNERFWDSGFTISRTSKDNYRHARNSLLLNSHPSPRALIDRVEGVEGDEWYKDSFRDCYLDDFVWATAMQTCRKQNERRHRFPRRDKVLEELIDRGIEDRHFPDVKNRQEEHAMRHASSMAQRLLVRTENLESKVRR